MRRFRVAQIAAIAVLLSLAACTLSPQKQAAEHRERADGYAQEGKWREASVEYQAALQKWPEDVDALYGFALTLDAMGEPGEHRKTLRKVLELQANHPGACTATGAYHFASGNFRDALSYAERAITADQQVG